MRRLMLSNQDPVMAAFTPCAEGHSLLEAFAGARPVDYAYLEPKDFLDVQGTAFFGIPEWDQFAEHVSSCSRCGEV